MTPKEQNQDRVYHLNLAKGDLDGAAVALLPGDPFRVPAVAGEIQDTFGGEAKEIAWKREFRTIRCRFDNHSVLVTSTGIGGPSAAIVIEELAMVGIRTFLRVGTTGAIQPAVAVGDVVITTGSVRLDGTSTHYAPVEYPAVAHHEVVAALIRGARTRRLTYHVGITVSSDTFYPGQERYDSFTGQVPKKFRGIMEEWRNLNVLNCEMESAALLTLTAAMGLRGGCVTGVLCNRLHAETIGDDDLMRGERNAIAAAVSSLEYLI